MAAWLHLLAVRVGGSFFLTMAKDQFWFKHESNTQDDPRHMEMIEDLGMEGYGIYWGVMEKLRSAEGYTLPLSVVKRFARIWGTTAIKVQAVIEKYGLFEVCVDRFFCKEMCETMSGIKGRATHAATVKWEKERRKLLSVNESVDAGALPPDSGSNAGAMPNDAYKIREDKIRRDKRYTYDDFVALLNEKTGKNYRGDKKGLSQFNARVKEGYSQADFESAVISAVKDQYHISEGFKYLTPEFMTRPDKLERFRTAAQVLVPKGRIAISKNPSQEAIVEYERIKSIGFDKCSQDEIEWVFDFQYRDMDHFSQKQYGDDMLAKRGYRTTMKAALAIR